jgi:hypothetical protein
MFIYARGQTSKQTTPVVMRLDIIERASDDGHSFPSLEIRIKPDLTATSDVPRECYISTLLISRPASIPQAATGKTGSKAEP